ncbi:MAG TPA: TIGR02569 family protein [Nocardioides sp.]|nr:TIGR02569 family protein [Nocardioides sp.]
MLKPVGYVPEHDWVCNVYAAWDCDAVRVPEPVAPRGCSEGGKWSVEGWGAHIFVPGRDADLELELPWVREASDAFHQNIQDLPRPDFMDVRNDPWSFGDRVAWEEAEPEGDAETLEVIRELTEHLVPVAGREQPIHGDVLPNVLIAAGLAPALIDWPVYFRPAGMANAIAVTDAVTFRGAPLALLDDWETGEDWSQLLVRALLYRLGATGLIASRNRLMGSLVSHVERVRPVVAEVLARS